MFLIEKKEKEPKKKKKEKKRIAFSTHLRADSANSSLHSTLAVAILPSMN